MPESRNRRRQRYTAPTERTGPRPSAANRWIAPAMVACWILGLLWIVVWYVAGDRIGFLTGLGNWNLLIGLGLILLGFVFAVRWE